MLSNLSGLVHVIICGLGILVVGYTLRRRVWLATIGIGVLSFKIFIGFHIADQRDWMHGLAVLALGALAILPPARARE